MLAERSTPICLMMSRRTSATVTFNITWSRPRTTIELTTLSAPPTSRPAISPACCASTGLATEPVNTTPSPTPSIWTPGRALLQGRAHAVEVALNRDIVGRHLLAVGVEEHDVGLTDGFADDVGALRRADDGVGDLGIGDQHILDVTRHIDDDRFADAERQKTCLRRPAGRGRHGLGIGSHHRCQRRTERQRGDGRKRQRAHQKGPHRRLNSPAFHLGRPFGHFCVVVEL